MPENGIRNRLSKSPFELHMWDDCGRIATGSGFFYELNSRRFLITNWHNVSGRHFLTKEPLSGRCPTFLKAKLFRASYEDSESYVSRATRFEIYADGEPLWLEHPEIGSACDVVALPIPEIDCGPMHNPSNTITEIEIPLAPGCSIFVVGFPRSISTGPGLPVWKSGYLASEPYFRVTIGGETSEIGGLRGGTILPAHFIDVETREGMSGSPVFAAFSGVWDRTSPYKSLEREGFDFNDLMFGNAYMFLGCYSARIGSKEEGAALGLCWPDDVIRKVCSGRRAKHPHFTA